MYNGYKTFEDIKARQMAREFTKKIYEITKKFPRDEIYCLISQMRRAAISISSNLSEGYGRFFYQENIQYCRIARGSVNEVISQIYVALDEKYITEQDFMTLYEYGRILEKAINGYILFLEQQKKKFA